MSLIAPLPADGAGSAVLPAMATVATSALLPPAVPGAKDLSRQVADLSYRANDAVLQSGTTRPATEAVAALWDVAGSWSAGQSNRKHDAITSAVDAVMAMLERM